VTPFLKVTVPEPPIVEFLKVVLPRGSWLDVRRAGGIAGIAPVS
jgi:hypothetical protein